jgi:hypothetical protein
MKLGLYGTFVLSFHGSRLFTAAGAGTSDTLTVGLSACAIPAVGGNDWMKQYDRDVPSI